MPELLRDKNIALLDSIYPGIKKKIEEKKDELLQAEGLEILEESAVSGECILKVKKEERSLYLAGKRSPSVPAKNQISLLGKIVPNAAVFMVGMGNMHYLEELWKVVDSSVIAFIYEPSFSIFYKQLEVVDLEPLLRDRLVVLVVEGINEEEVDSILATVLVNDRIPLVKNFTLPNYEELFPEKIRDFYLKMKSIMETYEVNIHTKLFFDKVIADNLYHNSKYVGTSYAVNQLEGVFPNDIPAIVVSAGPSLDKNIHELKRAKNKAFIIAVDTALKPLMRAGVVPDMYAVIDGVKPLELVDVEGTEEIPLLALPVAAKAVFDYHKGKKFLVKQDHEYLNQMFAMNGKKFYSLVQGGSVATLAFSLVCHLGFSTVVFVGQDLAFTGNKSHADGTLKDEVDPNAKKQIFVEGNYEDKIPSREDFVEFLKWYEQFIEYWDKNYNVEFINATEGGAKIKGTVLKTLKEVIDEKCTKEVDIAECFASIEPLFDEDECRKIEKYRYETPNVIHEIVKLAKEGQKLYTRLDKLCSSGNMDKNAYLKILTKIKKNRKKIEQNVHFKIVSDTMAKAELLIQTSQYFKYDTMEEEGKEIARQGKLYMELLGGYAEILEQIATEALEQEKTV